MARSRRHRFLPGTRAPVAGLRRSGQAGMDGGDLLGDKVWFADDVTPGVHEHAPARCLQPIAAGVVALLVLRREVPHISIHLDGQPDAGIRQVEPVLAREPCDELQSRVRQPVPAEEAEHLALEHTRVGLPDKPPVRQDPAQRGRAGDARRADPADPLMASDPVEVPQQAGDRHQSDGEGTVQRLGECSIGNHGRPGPARRGGDRCGGAAAGAGRYPGQTLACFVVLWEPFCIPASVRTGVEGASAAPARVIMAGNTTLSGRFRAVWRIR